MRSHDGILHISLLDMRCSGKLCWFFSRKTIAIWLVMKASIHVFASHKAWPYDCDLREKWNSFKIYRHILDITSCTFQAPSHPVCLNCRKYKGKHRQSSSWSLPLFGTIKAVADILASSTKQGLPPHSEQHDHLPFMPLGSGRIQLLLALPFLVYNWETRITAIMLLGRLRPKAICAIYWHADLHKTMLPWVRTKALRSIVWLTLIEHLPRYEAIRLEWVLIGIEHLERKKSTRRLKAGGRRGTDARRSL